jgi:hypothetical protein
MGRLDSEFVDLRHTAEEPRIIVNRRKRMGSGRVLWANSNSWNCHTPQQRQKNYNNEATYSFSNPM